jgi:hypothetical protein
METPLEETILISLQQDNPFGTITLQNGGRGFTAKTQRSQRFAARRFLQP